MPYNYDDDMEQMGLAPQDPLTPAYGSTESALPPEQAEAPMPLAGPQGAPEPQGMLSQMRESYAASPYEVSPEELNDLLGPAQGVSDQGAWAPEYSEPPAPLGQAASGMDMGAGEDPGQMRAAMDERPYDKESVKEDIRGLLMKRAQDRAALSQSYQEQAEQLGDEM